MVAKVKPFPAAAMSKVGLWLELDITLRLLSQVLMVITDRLGLSVVEFFIIRALYESDGQHASHLAKAVGRAATSFTPNLDRLEAKGWLTRKADKADRRAVTIWLTAKAWDSRNEMNRAAAEIDRVLADVPDYEDLCGLLSVVRGVSL